MKDAAPLRWQFVGPAVVHAVQRPLLELFQVPAKGLLFHSRWAMHASAFQRLAVHDNILHVTAAHPSAHAHFGSTPQR